jgi:hypothetical protein
MLRAIPRLTALSVEKTKPGEKIRGALYCAGGNLLLLVSRGCTDPKEIQRNWLSRWTVNDKTPARPSAAASKPSASSKRVRRRVSRAQRLNCIDPSRSAAPRRWRARALECLSLTAAEPRYASQRVRRRMAKQAHTPAGDAGRGCIRVDSRACST